MSESPPPSSSSEEIPYLTPSPPQQEQLNMNRHQCQNFSNTSIPSLAQTSTSDRFDDTDSYLDVLAVASAANQLALSLNFDDDDSVSTAVTTSSGVQQQQQPLQQFNALSGIPQSFDSSSSPSNLESQNVDAPGTQHESQALMRQLSSGSPLMTPNLVAEDACPLLPEVPMISIFGHLSLYQLLIILPQVSSSPTWTNVVNDSSHSRRQLTILLGPGAEKLLAEVLTTFPSLSPVDQDSQLVFLKHHLSPEASSILTRKLPRISSLTLAITRMDEEEFSQILQLLNAWAHHLTELIFAIDPQLLPNKGKASRYHALCFQAALNRLSHLHHLTLFVGNLFDELAYSPFRFDLPVFSTLEVLNLPANLHLLFLKSISEYMAGSASARSIDFGPYYLNELDEIEAILSLPAAVTRLLRRLVLYPCLPEAQFIILTDKCPHLTALNLNLGLLRADDILTLPLLSRRLRSLTLLTELTLCTGDLGPHGDALEEHLVGLPAGEELHLNPLPSVTSLTLQTYGYVTSHDDLSRLYLHQLLPNLERLFLNVDDFGCTVCDFEVSAAGKSYADEEEAKVACMGQLADPVIPRFGRLQLAQLRSHHSSEYAFTLYRAQSGPSGEMIPIDLTEETAAARAKQAEDSEKNRAFRLELIASMAVLFPDRYLNLFSIVNSNSSSSASNETLTEPSDEEDEE